MFDHDGLVALALALTLTGFPVDGSAIDVATYGRRLVDATADLTAAIGGRGPIGDE